MPYATNDGARIHYERGGSRPLLVLQHRFTRSLEGRRGSGYVDALNGNDERILVDARVHDLTGKPHNPAAYMAEKHAVTIIAILDDAGVDREIY